MNQSKERGIEWARNKFDDEYVHCSIYYTTILEIELVFSLEVKLELGTWDGTCDGLWLGDEVGIELLNEDVFSSFICRSILYKRKEKYFLVWVWSWSFILKMGLNLGSVAFRGSVTASRLEDKYSYNTVTDATTSRKCLDPVQYKWLTLTSAKKKADGFTIRMILPCN